MNLVNTGRTILRDLNFALRTLRRTPGFTLVAVLTLALGIGANTAIFTLLNQVLLRLLPVKDPHSLVMLTMRGKHYGSNWGSNAISYPMYKDFRAHNEVFSGMTARFPIYASVTIGNSSERVKAELVSGTYFDVLGVTTALGRPFTPDDDKTPHGHPLVMLSYNYWRERFAAKPDVIGSTVLVNNQKMTIVGVAQAGFDGVELGDPPSIFVPMMMQVEMMPGNKDMLTNRRNRWVNVFGRLKPGVHGGKSKSVAAALHALDARNGSKGRSVSQRFALRPRTIPEMLDGCPARLARTTERAARTVNSALGADGDHRHGLAHRVREHRKSPSGACDTTPERNGHPPRHRRKRGRIISQLLIEMLVLALTGGVLGLLLAFWADKALMSVYLPADSARLNITTTPDLKVLLFTFGVSALTALAFGLVPALQTTKPNVGTVLKDEASAVVGSGNKGLRKSLVVVQVALSLLLLIGAGLFLRSLENLSHLGPGFNASRLIGFEIDPTMTGYNRRAHQGGVS